MEGKIEVGDVFAHIANGGIEYVATRIDDRGRVWAGDGYWSDLSNCRLVRKADPYHGITLPEPPAGYRLAKWGEERDNTDRKVLFWSASERWIEWQLSLGEVCYDKKSASRSIFAIPLDQPSPLKSWQFRESPWVAPEPKTLADVPENTPCIAYHTEELYVAKRVGAKVTYLKVGFVESGTSAYDAKAWKFVRYLDTPPQKPLSLDDVPDGRVIRCQGRWHWKSGTTWWRLSDSGGVWPNMAPRFGSEFTITNTVAEFK